MENVAARTQVPLLGGWFGEGSEAEAPSSAHASKQNGRGMCGGRGANYCEMSWLEVRAMEILDPNLSLATPGAPLRTGCPHL